MNYPISDCSRLKISETGELLELDTGDETARRRFAELAEENSLRLRRAFNSEAVDSLSLSTTEPYLPTLLSFFKRRERRH